MLFQQGYSQSIHTGLSACQKEVCSDYHVYDPKIHCKLKGALIEELGMELLKEQECRKSCWGININCVINCVKVYSTNVHIRDVTIFYVNFWLRFMPVFIWVDPSEKVLGPVVISVTHVMSIKAIYG